MKQQKSTSREHFTFHRSWMQAMSLIAAKSVRNKLLAAITEYGLSRTYTPIGNKTADALMILIMDQIDRESECAKEPENDAVEPECTTIGDVGSSDVPTVEAPSPQEETTAVEATGISESEESPKKSSQQSPQQSPQRGVFAAQLYRKANNPRRKMKIRKHRVR